MDTGAIRTVMPLFYLYLWSIKLWSIKTQLSCAFSLLKLLIGSVALVCSLFLCSSNALAAQVVLAWNDPNNNPAGGCHFSSDMAMFSAMEGSFNQLIFL